MRPPIVFVIVYVVVYISTIGIDFVFHPAPLANILGLVSLLCYLVTLLPSILRIIIPNLKKHKAVIWLLKYRRYTGVASFGFAANHGVLLIIERNLNLFDWHTYIHYFQGISSFAILILLTITSNDSSLKSMKKNWRKLHQLSYLLVLILPWHISDKMSGHWTMLTLMALSLTIGIGLLLAWCKWQEQSWPAWVTFIKSQQPQPIQTSQNKH